MRTPVIFVLDLVLVLVFAAIGRRSHAEVGGLVSALATAWPFLAGVLVGWVVALGLRMSPTSLRGGVPIWLSTVAVGMLLRVATHHGVQFSFVLVALTVLAIFLLLPRLVAQRAHHHPRV